ncbi:MAG: nucleotide sugar dehydrogenase [Thermincola sp.]|jgi:UDP-N-acetyl-D-glucosamine dehydrogenase|nr:nucleotide sugar dehydrogenase [Thermincola sp.]MDT3703465.1 nucleotide sugar dehydrogenase [Thermincola sp.]
MLMDLILDRKAVVGVIGLGYVGLPLAVEMAEAGYRVYGIDINEEKVQSLVDGHSYIIDVESDKIAKMISSGKFHPTTDFSVIAQCDAVSICVPTPLRKTKDPDVTYITSAVAEIKKYMHKGMLITLESTTYPGTTEELIQHEIEELGYVIGEDFYVCFSPERVDPGNPVYNTQNTPKVIGGITPVCTELGCRLYGQFLERVVPVSSTKVAEMVKLLENTFRSVNIGLVNELALMCDRMGINVWEVIDAAATKPFGFMPFYPGPGIGGHCIPLDPMYLSWKAKMFNFYNKFIELASDINGNMPRYAISKLMDALNMQSKSLRGSKILILGMAYKKDIDDVRESPALDLYALISEKGADVDYHDPFVPTFRNGNEVIKSVELTSQNVGEYDCVVLATNHSVFDYKMISEKAKLILDTRNGFKQYHENIVKLGAPLETGAIMKAYQEILAGKYQ